MDSGWKEQQMMKWIASLGAILVLVGWQQDALALREFRKAFTKHYAEVLADKDVAAVFRKAKCNLCHVKGEKKDQNNPYGEALSELIEGDAEQRLKVGKADGKKKETLEVLLAELTAAMEQVEALPSPDGETYGERIRSGRLPVEIPAGDDSEDEEEEDE